MDEELVSDLEAAIKLLDGGNYPFYAGLFRRAVQEIRRLDVIIKEGQRQTHNEMYGRNSSGMAIPTR